MNNVRDNLPKSNFKVIDRKFSFSMDGSGWGIGSLKQRKNAFMGARPPHLRAFQKQGHGSRSQETVISSSIS